MAGLRGSLILLTGCFVLLLNIGSVVSRDSENRNRILPTPPSGIVFREDEFGVVRSRLRAILQWSNTLNEILALQEEEFETNGLYRAAWDMAVGLFIGGIRDRIFNIALPNSIYNWLIPEELHIALIAYTLMHPPLYRDFNGATRFGCFQTDVCIECYPWASFFQLLQLAVEILGSDNDQYYGTYYGGLYLYRGVGGAYDLRIGEQFGFPHFTSTSVSPDVAVRFARRGGTLFEIRGVNENTLAMTMWDHSAQEGQQEVLLSPFNVFRVEDIRVQDDYTIYVLVFVGHLQE